MKIKTGLRHTCEGRYPVSMTFQSH